MRLFNLGGEGNENGKFERIDEIVIKKSRFLGYMEKLIRREIIGIIRDNPRDTIDFQPDGWLINRLRTTM